jgi:quinol monooxygenase YgiN
LTWALKVYTVPEHADQVEAVYKETTKLAQGGEGVVYYCLGPDTDDPSIFHFFERYQSKQGVSAALWDKTSSRSSSRVAG